MRALVTGAAGFIGSHLVERLCSEGWQVRAVDCFSDYYDVSLKKRNLDGLQSNPSFEFVELDLATDGLTDILDGVDVVFHQAGQPGVRASFRSFDTYLKHNVEATRRLLEAASLATLRRFVFASSSSVYGDAGDYPTTEESLPRPQSPYGVSKLAAEHLCGVYARNFGVPAVLLRYFTVYGPRQRPDMAMNLLIASLIEGSQFRLYGDGTQVRDFTYVGDVVEANLLAASSDLPPGWTANVAGGTPTTMNEVIDILAQALGRPVAVQHHHSQVGDVARTGGSIARIRTDLGWEPSVRLKEGLEKQVDWQLDAATSDRSIAGV